MTASDRPATSRKVDAGITLPQSSRSVMPTMRWRRPGSTLCTNASMSASRMSEMPPTASNDAFTFVPAGTHAIAGLTVSPIVSSRNRSDDRKSCKMDCTSRCISSSLPAVLPLVSRNSVTSIGTDSIDTASTVCATPLSVSAKSAAVRFATTLLPRLTETLTETSDVVARKADRCATSDTADTASATPTIARRLAPDVTDAPVS